MPTFNNILRKAHKELNIPIYEIVLFIEENFIKILRINSMLDEENRLTVKEELAAKHNIKLPKTALYKLLY